MVEPLKKNWDRKKNIYIYILDRLQKLIFDCPKKLDPLRKTNSGPSLKKFFDLQFFSLYTNGDTIRIGQEIQCLPYAGFYF